MKRYMKKAAALFTVFFLIMSMISNGVIKIKAKAPVFVKIYLDYGNINFQKDKYTYTALDETQQTINNPDYKNTIFKIFNAHGVEAVTNNNINIDGCNVTIQIEGLRISPFKSAPIMIKNGSNVNLQCEGDNYLVASSDSDYAALEVQGGSSVSITSVNLIDTLYTTGSGRSPAIGVGVDATDIPGCNNIKIITGNIYANKDNKDYFVESPGIGTCRYDSKADLNIDIRGGKVYALGNASAGIGQGDSSVAACNINISGGNVEAICDKSFTNMRGCPAAIGQGAGSSGQCQINITGGTVKASTLSDDGASNIGYSSSGNPGCSTYISGGSVDAGTIKPVPYISPTNNKAVYPVEIILPKGDNLKLDYFNIKQSEQPYSYGDSNIQASDSSSSRRLFFWLPQDNNTSISLTLCGKAGSDNFTNIHGKVDDTGINYLKMDRAIEIQGVKSSYNAGDLKTSPIAPKVLCQGNEVTPSSEVYTGRDGTSYNSCDVPVHVGKYTVTAIIKSGDSYYDSKASCDFEISSSSFQIDSIPDEVYTGSDINPHITVKDQDGKVLTENTDYKVSYSNNINVGNADVNITGINQYADYKGSAAFKITENTLWQVNSIPDQVYTGAPIEPAQVKYNGTELVKGTNYNISYTNNTNVGEASYTVSGIGQYKGEKSGNFKIIQSRDFKVDSISPEIYTGSSIEPNVKAESKNGKVLVKGTDYIVTYDNNINAGVGQVIVTGIGNYTGTVSASFTINPTTLFSVSDIKNQKYTGSEIKPNVKVTDGSKCLVNDNDYSSIYSNNVNVGTATVEIQGKGNYTGTKKVYFTIEAAPSISITGNPKEWSKNARLMPNVTAGSSGLKSLMVNGTDITGNYESGYLVTENGDYTFTAESNSGITSSYTEHVSFIDTKKPVIELPKDSIGWSRYDVKMPVLVSDDLSGIRSVTYETDEPQNKQRGAADLASGAYSIVLTHEGSYNVIVTATDNAGNESSSKTLVKIDKTAPEKHNISVSGNVFNKFLNAVTFGNFFKDTVDVSIFAEDSLSGIKSVQYQKVKDGSNYDENGKWTDYKKGFTISPDDKFLIYAKVTDNAGNYIIINTDGIILDKTSPDLNLTAPGGWQTGDALITVNPGDALSGIKTVSYVTDEDMPKTGNVPIINGEGNITLSDEGQYNLIVTAEDNSGNLIRKTVSIMIDKTKPIIKVTGNPTSPVQSAVLSIEKSAGPSGIKSVTVSKDKGNEQLITGSEYTVSENGNYSFEITNNAGVKVLTEIDVSQIDKSKPLPNINLNGYIEGAWSKDKVKIDVSNDNKKNLGTTIYEYSLDGGIRWIPISESIISMDEGIKNYTFRAISAAGIVSDSKNITVKVDKTSPDMKLTAPEGWQSGSVVVKVHVLDNMSGLKKVSYTTDETAPMTGTVSLLNDEGSITLTDEGKYCLKVTAEDNSGNETINTLNVMINNTKKTINGGTINVIKSPPFTSENSLLINGGAIVYKLPLIKNTQIGTAPFHHKDVSQSEAAFKKSESNEAKAVNSSIKPQSRGNKNHSSMKISLIVTVSVLIMTSILAAGYVFIKVKKHV